MKKFIKEFKEFALKGNMFDMAVGMIIGAAFTALVNNLVTNIFNPIIGLITGGIDLENALKLQIGETEVDGVLTPLTINFGAFISAIINFVIMALVVFMIVKAMNKARSLKKEEEAAPTTKKCPFCKSEIPIEATRCPHCTSELPEEE
ncbi:MAG: large conductance mechanosensitive channel protein MscL [Lachnospiraceae bacterium]|nr:large conductance mechanosensitive channel protein MscL [Lachnospiraceae bacterium]